jgi:arylsulfatase A-like enzyme
MNTSRTVLSLTASILTSLFTSLGASAKPNIVFVLADDHAWEAVSAYGSYLKDFAKTPHIDRLGQEGMRFNHFVCANSICSPSRASFITGQYSHRNGVRDLAGTINETSPWLSEELQKAGYETLLVGKWHLNGRIRGYDKHMTVSGQGRYFDPRFKGSEGNWEREGYSTDVYTDIALDWLKTRDAEKPFYLCLQFKAPHHDYGHAARYDTLLAEVTIPEPATLYDDVRESNSILMKQFLEGTKFHMLHSPSRPNGNYYARHLNDPAPNAMWEHDEHNPRDQIRVAYQHMIHKYIRCIKGNDDTLKRVLDYLDQERLADNTIVIYTSDQGYWLGQHGFYDKRLILETSIRMPFLIRYPGVIPPGSVNDDICMNIDLAPTLLDLAGLAAPSSMQGQSMTPLLRGEDRPANWRTASFYTYWGGEPRHYGLRTDRFTYVKIGGVTELFDRKQDPHQRMNVAGNPEYASIMATLESELQQKIKAVMIAEEDLPQKK